MEIFKNLFNTAWKTGFGENRQGRKIGLACPIYENKPDSTNRHGSIQGVTLICYIDIYLFVIAR